MKTLTPKEMQEINGGGLFQANGATTSFSLSSSTDSLITLTFERNYNNHYSKTILSIGNNINLNLNGFGAHS